MLQQTWHHGGIVEGAVSMPLLFVIEFILKIHHYTIMPERGGTPVWIQRMAQHQGTVLKAYPVSGAKVSDRSKSK